MIFRRYAAWSLTVVFCLGAALEAAAADPPATIWRFLGIPQGLHKIRDVTTNRRGNFPGLERKPPRLGIADPANLESKNPAIKKAAEIKMEEDLAPQKIKALKYLASIGCGCYPGVKEALMAALEDCTEKVRYEAAQQIGEAAQNQCEYCSKNCCCDEELTKKLAEIAYERDEKGCYIEASERVREAAAEALRACCPGQGPPSPVTEVDIDETIPTVPPGETIPLDPPPPPPTDEAGLERSAGMPGAMSGELTATIEEDDSLTVIQVVPASRASHRTASHGSHSGRGSSDEWTGLPGWLKPRHVERNEDHLANDRWLAQFSKPESNPSTDRGLANWFWPRSNSRPAEIAKRRPAQAPHVASAWVPRERATIAGRSAGQPATGQARRLPTLAADVAVDRPVRSSRRDSEVRVIDQTTNTPGRAGLDRTEPSDAPATVDTTTDRSEAQAPATLTIQVGPAIAVPQPTASTKADQLIARPAKIKRADGPVIEVIERPAHQETVKAVKLTAAENRSQEVTLGNAPGTDASSTRTQVVRPLEIDYSGQKMAPLTRSSGNELRLADPHPVASDRAAESAAHTDDAEAVIWIDD